MEKKLPRHVFCVLEANILIMWNVICISIGACFGANLRYFLTLWSVQKWGPTFPYGTMIINTTGSLLIGFVLTWGSEKGLLSEPAKLLVVTGFLGAYTTFSTFSYESLALLGSGNWQYAWLYLGGSVALGISGAFLGSMMAKLL
jgi:CrcB protein